MKTINVQKLNLVGLCDALKKDDDIKHLANKDNFYYLGDFQLDENNSLSFNGYKFNRNYIRKCSENFSIADIAKIQEVDNNAMIYCNKILTKIQECSSIISDFIHNSDIEKVSYPNQLAKNYELSKHFAASIGEEWIIYPTFEKELILYLSDNNISFCDFLSPDNKQLYDINNLYETRLRELCEDIYRKLFNLTYETVSIY